MKIKTTIPAPTQSGFTLIELLIVIAVATIMALVAVPSLLASRRAANEASAISSLKLIYSAEASYSITHDGCCANLPALTNSKYLDEQIGGDGTKSMTEKSGFAFTVIPNNVSGNNRFIASGSPLSSNSGTNRFGTDASGLLRYDDDPTRLTTPFVEDIRGNTLFTQGVVYQPN